MITCVYVVLTLLNSFLQLHALCEKDALFFLMLSAQIIPLSKADSQPLEYYADN